MTTWRLSLRRKSSAAETGRASLGYGRCSLRLGRSLSALTMLWAGARLLLVVALPALGIGAISHRLSRLSAAGVALLLGVLALGAGLIARSNLLIVAGVLYLLAGISSSWGVNRGLCRRRAWINRALSAVAAVLVTFLFVYPTLIVVDYLAKPRAAIDEAALGLPHERVSFPASDGVHLAGWYVRSRNGAAIVVVHGGGGDRQGTIRHARMLADAGYGVLLYDARGRGESGGHENAFYWRWDRSPTCTVACPISCAGECVTSGCSAFRRAPKPSSPRPHRIRASKPSSRTWASGPHGSLRRESPCRSETGSRSSLRCLWSPAPRSNSRAARRNRGRSWSLCTRLRATGLCC